MRLAYKAFNADLTCTMGRGTFQYEPGIWYEEKEANCVKNGLRIIKIYRALKPQILSRSSPSLTDR